LYYVILNGMDREVDVKIPNLKTDFWYLLEFFVLQQFFLFFTQNFFWKDFFRINCCFHFPIFSFI